MAKSQNKSVSEKVNIGVVLLPDAESLKFIRSLNRYLVDKQSSLVDFTKNSIPHLLLGHKYVDRVLVSQVMSQVAANIKYIEQLVLSVTEISTTASIEANEMEKNLMCSIFLSISEEALSLVQSVSISLKQNDHDQSRYTQFKPRIELGQGEIVDYKNWDIEQQLSEITFANLALVELDRHWRCIKVIRILS